MSCYHVFFILSLFIDHSLKTATSQFRPHMKKGVAFLTFKNAGKKEKKFSEISRMMMKRFCHFRTEHSTTARCYLDQLRHLRVYTSFFSSSKKPQGRSSSLMMEYSGYIIGIFLLLELISNTRDCREWLGLILYHWIHTMIAKGVCHLNSKSEYVRYITQYAPQKSGFIFTNNIPDM